MDVGAATRRQAFWLLDRARGGSVRRHYEEVRATMEGRADPGAELDRLLAHATATTRFYAPFAGAGLEAFPVIDKLLVRSRMDDFRSSAYRGQKLHETTTSGSTGTPFRLDQDQGKRKRAAADLIALNEMAGFQLGDRLLWLRSWRYWPRSRFHRLARNIVPVDIVGMDDARREQVVQELRGGRVRAMLGFASTLSGLARYVEAHGYDPGEFGLRVVISSAETLRPPVRRQLEAAFGCPVADRYATEEHGMLACTRPGQTGLLLNRASYRFELLKPDADIPQQPGELARVVVTDLFNHAVPLIRYDTGDLAVPAADGEGPITALRSVEGRTSDVILDTSGGEIYAGSIAGIITKNFEIDQYQLVQDAAASYTFRVVPGEGDYTHAAYREVLAGFLGADADITIETSDSLESDSGQKLRPVVRRDPGAAS